MSRTKNSVRGNETLVLALPKGRILKRGRCRCCGAPASSRNRPSTTRSAPAPLRDQHPGPRHHPRAQLRRRDLRRLRRGAARRRRQRRADGVRLSGDLRAARSRASAHCRMSVAEPADLAGDDDPTRWSHVRVATKYPEITRRHFAARGVQAECIKLNGAMELAPTLGPVPAHRRSGLDRRDAEGQRPGRDRADRRRHLAPDRQPRGAEDAAGRDRRLDRPLRRGGRDAADARCRSAG